MICLYNTLLKKETSATFTVNTCIYSLINIIKYNKQDLTIKYCGNILSFTDWTWIYSQNIIYSLK